MGRGKCFLFCERKEPALKSISCYACQFVWGFEPPLGRRDHCPKCMTDAKVCLNCTFFDRGAHHECRESSAEWVRDKELGNFCGYFQGISARDASGTESLSQMQQLDSLFKQDATEPSAKKITSLDDLFKK